MMKKHFKKGFSLVELLVVITIIAILSVVAFTAVGGQTVKARNAKRKQDMNIIQSALELYFIENSAYPATLTAAAIPKKFLSTIPLDPKDGVSYGYGVSGSTFQVAATLENEDDPSNVGEMEAYVVGNGDNLIAGTGDDCTGGNFVVGGDDCIAYNPYTP